MQPSIWSESQLGLSRAEIDARFDRLQSSLVKQWQAIQSINQLEQSMIVVPSVSVDLDAPGTILQAYEERMLFLLFLLRKPLAKIVYCTSQPILPVIVDYYLDLLPGVISSHARKRLTTVAVHDASPRPLTQKILERPAVVAHLKSLIPDPATTHLVPFNTTHLERDLALLLGIPMYGADPRHDVLGSKSGCRRIFSAEGIDHPVGVEGLTSEDDLVAAIRTIRSERPAVEQVIAKLNQGVSGDGNALITLTDLPSPGSSTEPAAIVERVRAMRCNAAIGCDAFLRLLATQHGVVEERITGTTFASPSVQGRITPLGKVELISTHDQVLGGPSGQSYLGCRFPADRSYAPAISRATAVIGDRLRREGVLGRFAVDFVVVRDAAGPWRHLAIEINLRKGGTTAPYLTLEFLTDGRYDHESGVFTTRHGGEKHYMANDHVESPLFRSLTPDDLFDIVIRHGLHFDHTTQTGVVLHMMSAVTEQGRFGLTAVADSREDAQELYDRTVATFGFEAERASRQPGLQAE